MNITPHSALLFDTDSDVCFITTVPELGDTLWAIDLRLLRTFMKHQYASPATIENEIIEEHCSSKTHSYQTKREESSSSPLYGTAGKCFLFAFLC